MSSDASLRRFCAKCGTRISLAEASSLGNLCPSCYAEVHGTVALPREIPLTFCRKCLSVKVRGRWLPIDLSSEEAVVERINHAIKSEVERSCCFEVSISLTPREAYEILSGEQVVVTVTLSEDARRPLKVRGTPKNLDVRPQFSICPTCLKVVGKKFEATIQLRGFDEGELERIKSLVNKLIVERSGGSHNLQTGAVWEEVDGGVDIKLPSIDAARKIANLVKKNFDVQVKESFKDSGWDRSRGKPLRKLTILLRSRNA
ncbi:MAG: 60S ribosomal export protein NMD3 [Candidatus Verstraetearchaeota archaeon]|jgi:NMD protein affecting ribosome stability and mRNA decay|nr:60S ribosomal export protein NMD3 [Candidatus Verstraetearchaeota archaeon]